MLDSCWDCSSYTIMICWRSASKNNQKNCYEEIRLMIVHVLALIITVAIVHIAAILIAVVH